MHPAFKTGKWEEDAQAHRWLSQKPEMLFHAAQDNSRMIYGSSQRVPYIAYERLYIQADNNTFNVLMLLPNLQYAIRYNSFNPKV